MTDPCKCGQPASFGLHVRGGAGFVSWGLCEGCYLRFKRGENGTDERCVD